MSDDGRIYTETGKILTANPKRNSQPPYNQTQSLISRGSLSPLKPVPALGGLFVLGIDAKNTLQLFQASTNEKIAEIGELPLEFQAVPKDLDSFTGQAPQRPQPRLNDEWAKTTFTFDKRIIFAPHLGYLAFVPYTNDRIIVRPFHLEQVIEKLGDSVLLFTSSPDTKAESGQEWRYEATAISNAKPVKFSFALQPEGMEISEAGVMTWKIPGGIKGTADVVLKAIDAKGNEKEQGFTISFK